MKKNKRLMKINEFLSRKEIVIALCAISTIILFFAANYLFITILHLPQQFKNDKLNINLMFAFSNCFTFSSRYWLFYTIAIIGLIIFNLRFSYLLRISYAPQNIGQKGVARWTTLKEIQQQYKAIPEKTYSYPGNGGVPIARYKDKIYIDDSPVNNLIIGITRSGKGEMFVFPTIDIYSRAERQPSLIVTDPKLELAAASYDTLTKRGYEVHVLNLIEPTKSMGFNPLQSVIDAYKRKDYSEAELLANTFSFTIFDDKGGNKGNDDFWKNNSVFLTNALILAHVDDCIKKDIEYNTMREFEWAEKQAAFSELSVEEQNEIRAQMSTKTNFDDMEYIPPEYQYIPDNKYEKQITMYSIVNTMSELQRVKMDEFTTALDIYFRERPERDKAKLLYSSIESAASKTKGSIISNTLSKLNIFTYTEIAKMTAESSINLKDVGFGKKPMAIFLGIPDYDKSNHFLASVFIRQLYFTLAKAATNAPGGKCPREVIFLLDEFGNLPPIESMSQLITVCLGRNMRFNLIIQSYSQIEELYGKGDASTIIGNCGNQLYILTDDKETAEHYSTLIGKETVTDVTRSGQKMSLNKTITESYIEKPLLNANELMTLREGECIVQRVMKRTDNQRQSVQPNPIFNTGETKFKYRWQYLSDDFDNSKSLRDIASFKESCQDINLKKHTFDINGLFAEKLAKKSSNNKKSPSPQQAPQEINKVQQIPQIKRIKDLPKTQFICSTTLKVTDLYKTEDIENMTTDEYAALVYELMEQGKISDLTKETLLNLL